ncbi:MAG TPA: PIG-L family deacetylase, partial [Mycobacteriales bacterium]|nr:PIG-L family deacetylase [Mycobacteriales bacterium]
PSGLAVPTRPPVPAPSLTGRCAVVLHAHPDDEAIFTAATVHRLTRAGARVVLVTATAGELGPVLLPLRAGETLADRRRAELEAACALLGVARLVLLGHRDSGMAGWSDNAHPRALAAADPAAVAGRLADLCSAEGAEALVHYDPGGIYGHPDHVAVHRVGAAAAGLARLTAYEATVDATRPVRRRPHLVDRAAAGGPVGWDAAGIATVVAADGADLAAKRAAMAAHASQVPRDAVRRAGFAAAYGREWYRRVGPPGIVDEVGTGGTPGLAGALGGYNGQT